MEFCANVCMFPTLHRCTDVSDFVNGCFAVFGAIWISHFPVVYQSILATSVVGKGFYGCMSGLLYWYGAVVMIVPVPVI